MVARLGYGLPRVLAAGLLASACTPVEAFRSDIDSLVSANKGIATAVQDVLAQQRTRQRQALISGAITNAILAGRESVEFVSAAQVWTARVVEVSSDDVFATATLCMVQEPYFTGRAAQTYSAAVGAALKEIAREQGSELPALVGSIFTDWNEKFPSFDNEAAEKSLDNCKSDISAYASDVYPDLKPAGPEGGLAGVSAAFSLLEVLYSVGRTALLAGAQEVDRARRAKAVSAWLSDSENIEKLKKATKDSTQRIVAHQRVDRRAAVAAFIVAARPFSADGDASRASRAALATAECRELKPNQQRNDQQRADAKRSFSFQKCHARVQVAISEFSKELLLAASNYDRLVDVRFDDPAKEFDGRLDDLQKIASGTLDPRSKEGRAVITAYFNTAMRLEALIRTATETASNAENAKKIDAAVDKLKKTWNF